MANAVHVIGAARTDFKRNFRKEGKTIRDMIVEAGRAALADAGVEARDIQSAVVGNFAGGLYTRQLHLGSFITDIDESLRGIPTLHTEAACASGGVAVLTGAQQIMGGLHDLVLVVGAEQQKTMSPAEGADVLAAAGDIGCEKPIYGEHMFPKLFGRIAQIYRDRYGLSERDLARVAARNHANARKNPLAQMRDSTLTVEEAAAESEANRMIAPPLKLSDCSQITDGAAAIVLCSAPRSGKRSLKMLGYGHTTDHLPLEAKSAPEFPIARLAAKRAFEMARLTPADIQAAEVHDCFSISQILALEILGFADSGKGVTKLDGPVIINPGGGLIGDGHPVGATGVRQVCEAFLHLTENAGARQVPGAKHYLTFNMGGTMTTSVVTIWGK